MYFPTILVCRRETYYTFDVSLRTHHFGPFRLGEIEVSNIVANSQKSCFKPRKFLPQKTLCRTRLCQRFAGISGPWWCCRNSSAERPLKHTGSPWILLALVLDRFLPTDFSVHRFFHDFGAMWHIMHEHHGITWSTATSIKLPSHWLPKFVQMAILTF